MTIYVGGLRARLISESLFQMVKQSLGSLGWFDAGRQHAPINLVAEPQDLETEIPLNTLAIIDENLSEVEGEVGSLLADHNWVHMIDFYAESDAIGKQLIFDVRDILTGRMPSIGRTGPTVNVYDYTQGATPPQIFYVDITNVRLDRGHNWPHPWLQHWFSLQFFTEDHYADENG